MYTSVLGYSDIYGQSGWQTLWQTLCQSLNHKSLPPKNKSQLTHRHSRPQEDSELAGCEAVYLAARIRQYSGHPIELRPRLRSSRGRQEQSVVCCDAEDARPTGVGAGETHRASHSLSHLTQRRFCASKWLVQRASLRSQRNAPTHTGAFVLHSMQQVSHLQLGQRKEHLGGRGRCRTRAKRSPEGAHG